MSIVLIIGLVLVSLLKTIGYEPARVKLLLWLDKISIINFYEQPVYNGWFTLFVIISIIFFFYELLDNN